MTRYDRAQKRSTHLSPKRKRGGSRRGFTLAEVVVSMAITTIVLGGSISAILIAGHALPDADTPTEPIVRVSDVANELVEELTYAIHFTERTATSVAFTVADRDGDDRPEKIRYDWAGTPGDPLTREYNDRTAVEVLPAVTRFNLSYDLTTLTETYPGAGIEGSETLLSVYSSIQDIHYFKIEKKKWLGQYVEPTLAAEAISWSATRALFRMKSEGARNELTLGQLRTADVENKPTQTVLEEVPKPESDLSTDYRWEEFAFSSVRGLTPGDALCLVLKHPGDGGPSARMYYDDDDGSGLVKTDDGESKWSSYASKSMRYYLYGTVTTAGASQTAARRYLTDVRVGLQTDGESAFPIETAVRLLNTPELLSAVWELDFDSDPTGTDVNGDGIGDWVVRGGGTFDPESLVDGVWHADATLDTFPNNDFTELTTVDLQFRNTSVGGKGAVFWINLDRTGDTFGVVYASLALQPDGTQILRIYTKTDNSTPVPLRTTLGLPDGFVKLRLVLDPGTDTVSITVNGHHQGTYTYATFDYVNDDRFASILGWGSDAEFDHVSIRVAGGN